MGREEVREREWRQVEIQLALGHPLGGKAAEGALKHRWRHQLQLMQEIPHPGAFTLVCSEGAIRSWCMHVA